MPSLSLFLPRCYEGTYLLTSNPGSQSYNRARPAAQIPPRSRMNSSSLHLINFSVGIESAATATLPPPPPRHCENSLPRMDSPADSQQTAPKTQKKTTSKPKPSPAKTTYLILYNSLSALLWSVVLGRVLLITSVHGWQSVFLGAGDFTKWTQTLAGLEVLHAATGTIR